MKQVKKAVHYWCEDTLSGKYLGQGIGIATLDTGIANHPDLKDRVRSFHDIVNGRKTIYDDSGHGTHVSGILAGTGKLSNGRYAGMAQGSHLVVVKVLDEKGNGNIQDVLRGLRWILDHHKEQNIRIVNISVGTMPHADDREEMELVRRVEEVWDAGMIVVASAGNYGPAKGSVTIPGISRKIITVGSSNDQYYIDDAGRRKRNYSGRGPTSECIQKPDVVAPGSYITSCNAFFRNAGRRNYVLKSGTSMSAPVVAGAIAVVLSKYPDMKNVEVKLKLRGNSDDIKLPIEQQGWGLLNVEKLLVP